MQVSVPYRGFIILNTHSGVEAAEHYVVSVPYRGFIILNPSISSL